MERDRTKLPRPTEKHPLKGMQDRRLVPDPHVVFDRTVRGALSTAGADTKVIESVMPAIVTAANVRQRGIGSRTALTPDYDLQATLGDGAPVK